MDKYLQAAIAEAQSGLNEGGIPVGAVLVIDGEIVARGRNQRVQKGSPILHAETDCLANGGCLTTEQYKRSTLYSTLSPCDMCSGTILLYGIPKVVIGESRTFTGPEEYVRSRGVELVMAESEECYQLMQEFIKIKPDFYMTLPWARPGQVNQSSQSASS